VLAVSQRGKDDRAMQIVRSCGVDYMNIRVPRKFLVAPVDLWNAVSGCLLTYTFWLRRRDGDNVDEAQPANGVNVMATGQTKTDESHSDATTIRNVLIRD
jgi:hypothetical protein